MYMCACVYNNFNNNNITVINIKLNKYKANPALVTSVSHAVVHSNMNDNRIVIIIKYAIKANSSIWSPVFITRKILYSDNDNDDG